MYFTLLMITVILLAAYCCLILVYRQWYLRLPAFVVVPGRPATAFFSIIIPARNEEANISQCLHSILQQQYPASLYEVIVVNDHSTDQTETIIRLLQQQYANLKLINLEDHLDGQQLNAYKKKAIELAVAESAGNWIITTDADCTVGNSWLQAFDQFIKQDQPVFVAAPVMFTNNRTFLSLFQLLDFISLQGITAAAVSAGYHTMCNGANLAYRKDVFMEVGQFSGIDHIASGDDMLLMHKIKAKYPAQIGYLHCRDSIVHTQPMYSWKEFINQRIRWASKADQYRDKSIFRALLLVYTINVALLILPAAAIFGMGGISNWLLLMVIKTLVELSFMLPVSNFYQQTTALFWFPIMEPFHILYTVIAGWLGKFGSYQWKGRSVK